MNPEKGNDQSGNQPDDQRSDQSRSQRQRDNTRRDICRTLGTKHLGHDRGHDQGRKICGRNDRKVQPTAHQRDHHGERENSELRHLKGDRAKRVAGKEPGRRQGAKHNNGNQEQPCQHGHRRVSPEPIDQRRHAALRKLVGL